METGDSRLHRCDARAAEERGHSHTAAAAAAALSGPFPGSGESAGVQAQRRIATPRYCAIPWAILAARSYSHVIAADQFVEMESEEDPRRAVSNPTTRRLSDAETEMLISFVQGRPCLWNECHSDFKNAALRRNLWSQVGGRLLISGEEAKCKWKNLKDKFRKLRNIQEVRSSLGINPVTPKWKFYNSMLFTKDILLSDLANGHFTTHNNALKAECESLASDDNNSEPSTEDVPCSEVSIDKLSSEEPPLLSKSPALLGKRSRSPRACERGFKRKKNASVDSGKKPQPGEKRKGISSVSQEDKMGDDYHFLMSLLPYIEALDPLKKLELRFGIQKLVTDSYKKHVSKKGCKLRQSRGNNRLLDHL